MGLSPGSIVRRSIVRHSEALRTSGLPVVRPAIHRVMRHVFGPPGFDPHRHPGDLGLLGPDSASWGVIADQAAIAGGIRGLMMQVAHPLAMAGVADHSAFRTDPLGRLQRTSSYVTATTFGSVGEALDMVAAVRKVHPHVRGAHCINAKRAPVGPGPSPRARGSPTPPG